MRQRSVRLHPCGRQRRRKHKEEAQEARVQLQRQLYLSMRKTANYTEAQGSGKEEDGAPSANFVVAAQSRASGRWLVPACSRQCNKAIRVRGDTFTRQARKRAAKTACRGKAPRKRLQRRRRRLLLRRHAEFVGHKSLCHNSISFFSLSLCLIYMSI